MRLLFALFFMSIVVLNSAQLAVLKQNLLELEQNVYQKDFTKKWVKTTKKNWETKCAAANSIPELNELFNQFSDLFAQVTQFSMGNSDATDEAAFAEYLLKAKSVLRAEYIAKWNASLQNEWENRLQKVVAEGELQAKNKKQKEEGEKQLKRLTSITAVLKDFESNFKLVFEDSKKNSFKTLRSGAVEGVTKKSNATVNFSGASHSIIELNENGILDFKIIFNCNDDEVLADKMAAELIKMIVSNIPTTYMQNNSMDAAYKNKNKFVFEFVGEKFSETAKNTTISIGIDAQTKNVILIVTEPVFGK